MNKSDLTIHANAAKFIYKNKRVCKAITKLINEIMAEKDTKYIDVIYDGDEHKLDVIKYYLEDNSLDKEYTYYYL
jgi:hypothetical protein